MSQIISELDDLTNRKPLVGLPDAVALERLSGELERVKRLNGMMTVLQRMQNEFSERRAGLLNAETKLRSAVSAEAVRKQERKAAYERLVERQGDLKADFERIQAKLQLRAKDAQLTRIQKDELWNSIMRLAELVKGFQLTAIENSETLKLETLLQHNEERILQLQADVEIAAVDYAKRSLQAPVINH